MERMNLRLIALAGLAVSVVASPAVAQNALGDGRRLDRSLNTQSNYNSGGSRRAFVDDLRVRNAVVTGNAAGGRSFRGDVGYTGSSDFRGSLGSEDIFTFRRDASFAPGFNSGASRGIGGLETQMGMTSGSNVTSAGSNLARDQGGLLVRRAGAGATGADFIGQDASGTRRSATRGIGDSDRVDLRSDYADYSDISPSAQVGVGALRSTATYSTSQSFKPATFGQRREEDGSITSLTASSLRGVRATTTAPDGSEVVPLAANNAGARNAMTTSASTAINTQAGLTNPAAPRSAVAPAKTAYDALMERYKTQTGTTVGDSAAGSVEGWQKQLDELQDTLEGADSSTTSMMSGLGGEALPVDQPAIEPVRLYNQTTIDLILKQAGKTDQLLMTAEGRLGAFGERMRRGEQALATGRYFDAEESFSTCLSLRPGDVAASIGRVHAQLGAGMFLSAALNLRMTLGGNPAAVGERYGANLLPSAERCAEVIEELRTNARSQDRLGYESAILLAYLGFQTGDKSVAVEGLDSVDRLASGAANPVDSRFVELVRRVWIPILDRQPQSTPNQNAPADDAGGAPVGG